MASRRVTFNHRIHCRVKKYTLDFLKSGGYARITPSASRSSVVHGVCYDVDHLGATRLDKFEGVPRHYIRHSAKIRMFPEGSDDLTGCASAIRAAFGWHGVRAKAIVYLPAFGTMRPGLEPRPDYLHHLIGGADLVPEHHVNWLRGWHPGPAGLKDTPKYIFAYGILARGYQSSWNAKFHEGLHSFEAFMTSANVEEVAGNWNISFGQAEEKVVVGHLLTASDGRFHAKLKQADKLM